MMGLIAPFSSTRGVIPGGAQRRPGIHSGTSPERLRNGFRIGATTWFVRDDGAFGSRRKEANR